MDANEDELVIRCAACQVDFIGAKVFCQHIRNIVHQLPLRCAYCNNPFQHQRSLVRHIKDHHLEVLSDGDIESDGDDNVIIEPEVLPEINDVDMEDEGDESVGDNDDEEEDEPEINLPRSAALMILNLRQSGGITSTIIERFQDECFKMMTEVVSLMKQKVKSFLSDQQIDNEASSNLLREMQIEDPFSKIKTLKQQLTYFSTNMGLVEPIPQFIDYRTDYHLNPVTANYEPVRVPLSFQYIPVIETLTLALSNPRISQLINAEARSDDSVLRSYLDGTRAQHNPIVVRHPNVVRLGVYWDDLEVANPLGSKTTVHKLAAFYFTIQNLPAVESSQLSNIYLLTLAFSEDLKVPGAFEKILAPFMHDLRKLESDRGVMIQVNDIPFCLRATLSTLCADTLAAHEILGLLSPSARHFCRKCMISRPIFRQDINLVGEKRTRAMLQEHVEMVKARPNASTECGVLKSCPLNSAVGFDPTEDAPFDVFHDLLEGVCQWVISLALRSFVKVSKLFNIDDFNGRISAFNYGVNDVKNKPSANFSPKSSLKGKALKQSGSQVWCLMRVLGFLVPEVPHDDPNLKLVNLLQKIMLIVFAEEIREEDIRKCEQLTEEHHRLFQELHVIQNGDILEEDLDDPDYPADVVNAQGDGPNAANEKKVLPGNKLHHMKHYAEDMRKFGPLVRYWCARYEGRHHIFCKYGAVCCNFINIVKSMSNMFQISTLSGLLKTSFRSEEVEVQSHHDLTVEESDHRELLERIGLRSEDVITEAKAVRIAGENYRPGLFVLTDTAPVFSIIQRVYVKAEKEVYLIVLPWQTVGFESRYCAYEVKFSGVLQVTVLHHQSLSKHGSYAPWNPWKQRKVYIAPRTIIF